MIGIGHAELSGQGGTGYLNPGQGGGNVFTHSSRVNPIVAAAPTDILIVGSINDDSSTLAALFVAAQGLFAALVAALPDVRLHILLPQATTAAADAGTARQSNRLAILSAAKDAVNVHSIIDPIGEGWFTAANRSRFISTVDVCGLRTSLTLCRREILSAGGRVERCSS